MALKHPKNRTNLFSCFKDMDSQNAVILVCELHYLCMITIIFWL